MTGSLTRWGFLIVLGLSLLTTPAETNPVAAVTLGETAAVAFALTEQVPPVAPAVPEASLSVLRVFGALALVLGLFLGGVWCYKNWQRLVVRGGKSPRLNVLEVRSLGGRHALYLVGCDDQRLLLAASPTGVRLLTHLPGAAVPEDPEETPEDFTETLERAVRPMT